MRVVLDTTYARRGPSGTGVYLVQIAAALRDAGVDVVEIANERRRPPAGGGARSIANLLADAQWTQVELPRRAARAGADVLHHPLPALARRCAVPQVVTVHDLAFLRLPECFAPSFRRHAAITHRAAVRRAAAVVCVSETTRRDVLARWGADPARLVVAPHGPGQEPGAPAGPRVGGPCFLYVGDDEPRKNLATLRAAYADYRQRVGDAALDLVLAGSATADDPGVRCVPAPDVPALLAGALALVHPALHEGFGLTPLEAMHAGVPVIAGRSPGLAETCGDAALLSDPRDPAALASALERVGADPALRADLIARGRARAAQFSWAAAAQRHIEAYTLARGT